LGSYVELMKSFLHSENPTSALDGGTWLVVASPTTDAARSDWSHQNPSISSQ